MPPRFHLFPSCSAPLARLWLAASLAAVLFFWPLFPSAATGQSLINYDEAASGDLSGDITGPVFTPGIGINQWRGVIEPTTPSQGDIFILRLQRGQVLTGITYSGPADNNGATFTGFFEASGTGFLVTDRTGSVTRTYTTATGPKGEFDLLFKVVADFNISNKAWSLQVTVEPDPTVTPDTTPPTLVVPPDVVVEAGEPTPPATTGVATATDDEGIAGITFADRVVPGACPADITITRTWTATDLAGNFASGPQIIEVNDTTAPTLTVPPDVSVAPDSPTDPTLTGIATATDAGDPFPNVTSTDATTTTSIARTWIATDACGNRRTGTQQITIQQPPTITVDPSAFTGPEGSIVTATITGSDPDGVVSGLIVSPASIGTVSFLGGATWQWTATIADDLSTSITFTVGDNDGLTASVDFPITITNVAPTVISVSVPSDPVAAGSEVVVTAPFADPAQSADAPYTCVVDFGDGTETTLTDLAYGSDCTAPHTYTTAGVYAVTTTLIDKDGGRGSATSDFVAVYDPAAGFVTGAGLIDSPAGAYVANPALTGRARFGFVAKYKKGQQTPDGRTQFRFQAGDLRFESTAYDWLVIAGARAKYKGIGSVNGAPGYGFHVAGVDGDYNGSTQPDAFRIKIWTTLDDGTESVVYDNQPDEDLASEEATELLAGSIVIHDGKGPASAKALGLFGPDLPTEIALRLDGANPVRTATRFAVELPEGAAVSARVYDLLGRQVATLADRNYPAGRHTLDWAPQGLSSGMYLVRMTAGTHTQTVKVLVVR